MPHWCIAYGCKNSFNKPGNRSWHRLPLEDEELLKKWLGKIKRTNTPVNKHARICGDHFDPSCFVRCPGSSRVNLRKGSIPTRFCFVKEKQPRKAPTDRKALPTTSIESIEMSTPDEVERAGACSTVTSEVHMETSPCGEVTDERIETNLLKERIKELEEALMTEEQLKKQAEERYHASRFTVENLSKDEKLFKFYTGFSKEQFDVLFEFMGDAATDLNYWGTSGSLNTEREGKGKKPGPSRRLTPEDELLLVLARLRVGMLEQDLAARFEISQSRVSRIFTTWINALFNRFKELDIWPSREDAFKDLPDKIKEFCPTLRCIIDATEIYIEQPKNPEAQQLTFSSYKNRNTLKALVGITGSGAINFISTLEGGSISDRELTGRSGILEKDWDKGDVLMADRGFEIQDDLAPLGVKLNIPPFLRGKGQFNESELVETRRIASFRIHVERAIERIKNYRILEFVPVTMCSTGLIDQMFFVCAMLTNFQPPLISES